MSRSYDQPIIDVINYVYKYQLDEDDETLWKCARTSLLDSMGCAIETVTSSPSCRRFLGPIIEKTNVPNGFKVPGTEFQVDPLKGAFDLGILIRYLDHNDALGGAEWGHPSDNLGAIVSVMDWLSRASIAGDIVHYGPPLTMHTLLIALIKAYEIQACYQMQNAFNAYGIDHVILVKLASGAVVSWLLGLTEDQAMATVSHVWMDGHPSRLYRSGWNISSRKGWAAGDAARRAVQLAFMVGQGAEGALGALSARPFGFLERTFGDGFVFPRAFGSWTVRNVLIKTMPVEGHGISAVEAAVLQAGFLRRRGLVEPAKQIKRICLRVTEAACMIIDKKGPLYNAADRDHCIQYVVALALLKGSPPEAVDYLDESPWSKSEELEILRGKIVIQADSELQRDYLDVEKKSIGAGVTIDLENGLKLPEILIEYPLGHARNPQTPSTVQRKFFKNMSRMFSAAEISRMLGAVQQPDMLISDFMDLFIPSSTSKM